MKCVLKCVVVAGLLGCSLGAQGQGTAFSHQGFLTDAGESANGVFDLHFTPYDAATAGTAQAASNIFTAVQISNGLFTVTLDFGASVFNGSARWLETAVRSNGAASFTTLSPRQPLLPAPYAIYARGVVASGIVGTIKSGQLDTDVQTNLSARLSSNVWATTDATTNYVRRTGDTMTGALNLPAGGLAVASTQLVVKPSGFVGIGTANPTNLLEIRTPADGRGLVMSGPNGGSWSTYKTTGGGNPYLWDFSGDTNGYAIFRSGIDASFFISYGSGFASFGTGSPNARLHVFGNEIVSGVVTASAFSGSAGGLTIGSSQLVVTAAGNVGIGTASPGANLVVRGATNATAFSVTDGTSSLDIAAGTKFGNPTTGWVTLDPNGSGASGVAIYDGLLVNSGNSAFGTASPFSTLTLNGSLGFKDGLTTPAIYLFENGNVVSGRMVVTHSTGYPGWGLNYRDIGDAFIFQQDSANPIVTIEMGSKRMGIGVASPSYVLDVGSRMQLRGDDGTGSAGTFLYSSVTANQRGFIGLMDNGNMGFWGSGAGWNLVMNVTNGITGIGTTTPNARLHVSGNAIVSGVVTASAFSGSGAQLTGLSGAMLAAGTVANSQLATEVQTNITARVARVGDTMSGTLVLSNSAQFSERLRLSGQEYYGAADNSSNGISLLMGVNRTDNRQLWIADSARLGYTGSNSVIRLSPGTGVSGAFIDATGTDGVTGLGLTLGTGSLMHLSPSGKVGIGTSAPVVPLDVSQTSPGHLMRLNNLAGEGGIAGLMFSRTNQFMGQIGYVGTTNQIGYAGAGDVIFGSYNGADLRFDASPDGVEAMRLVVKASNGYVGVGTYTPTDELTVHGDIGLTYNSSRSISVGMQPDNNTEGQNLTIAAGAASSSGVPNFARKGGDLVLSGGNGYNINVADKDGGDVIIRSGANSISGTDNGGDIVLQTGAANNTFVERMRVMEGGNVGIGTTNPTALLHVGGNATISGTLTATAFSGSGGQITAGTISNTHLATAVQTNITARLASNVWAAADATTNYVRRTGDTISSTLVLSNSVQFSERLRLNGQEYYGAGNDSSNGITFLMGVNRTDNRQLWIADSARLGFTAANAAVRIAPGTGSSGSFIDAMATDGVTVLPLSLGNGNLMYLSPSGTVGIGTTSPGAKLHVVGNQIVSGVVTAAAFVGSAGGLTIGTTQLVVTSLGRVGIGTTNPVQKLEVVGNAVFKGGAAGSADPGDGAGPATRIGFDATGDYGFITANDTGVFTKRLVLQNNGGNVGIGTTNPLAPLHVAGNAIVNGNVGVGTATPASRLTVQSSSDADVGFRVTDGTTNGNVVIQALSGGLSGFSAINFNGYYNGGEQRFNTSKARWRMYADQRGTADTFVLERYNGSALAVLSALTNGNVGIGTASPNAQLHVLGNQIVSGVVTASAFVGSGAGLSGITVTNTVITNMVNKTGDTMYGALSLPANGLTIGTTQLVATAGGIAIGTASVSEGALVVNGVTHHNDYDVYLRSGSDRNHGLGWYGGGKLFANVNVDGPALFGYSGGVLGSATGAGGTNIALLWNSSGNVGIGTNVPGARLHVATGASGVAPLGGSVAAFESGSHTYISLLSPAASESGLIFANTNNNADGGVIYNSGTTTRGLQFRTSNNAVRMVITSTGNVGIGTETPTNKLHVAGVVQATAYVTGSDRASKENIQPVAVQDILAKVAGLPMATWSFKDDKSGRHLGPMAQDFNEAFGLGNTDTGIFTVDADGVALAAIQALNQKIEQKDARLDALQKQNEELRRQLDELRTLVEKVTQQAK